MRDVADNPWTRDVEPSRLQVWSARHRVGLQMSSAAFVVLGVVFAVYVAVTDGTWRWLIPAVSIFVGVGNVFQLRALCTYVDRWDREHPDLGTARSPGS